MRLVFDLDGTLIDSRPGIIEAFEQVSKRVFNQRHTLSQEDIGPPVRKMFLRAFPDADEKSIEIANKYFRETYDGKSWQNFEPYEAVIETLNIFSQEGVMLYLATNKPELPTLNILRKMGISDLFIRVSCQDQEGCATKETMLRRMLETPGKKDYMIGDGMSDCIGARAFGCKFIFCSYGYGRVDQSDHVIGKFKEIHFSRSVI